MTAFEWVFGFIIVFMAAIIAFAVLAQSSKDKSLSGAITGSAETFLGRSKAKTRDIILNRITCVLSIVFTVLAVIMYIVVS